jgi:hypothetical protein
VLADAGDDDGSSLPAGFLHHELPHLLAIAVVEMANGFVGKQEIERL